MNDITPLAELQFDGGDKIRGYIGAAFFADYGIVTAVNSDKTVNVTHAVMMEYINGDPAPLTTTNNVEVLFPASASFGQTWPIAVGDGVLLIGLKNKLLKTQGVQIPQAPRSEHPHYVQDTLKAIPLQTVANPAFQINVDASGLAQIKNQAQSLYTILNNLISHISGLTTIPAVVGSPLTLAPTVIAQLSADSSALSALLKP